MLKTSSLARNLIDLVIFSHNLFSQKYRAVSVHSQDEKIMLLPLVYSVLITFQVVTGTFKQPTPPSYVKADAQESVVADLVMSHGAGDMCLLGPRGCGKSTVAARVASILSLQLEPVVLYQDMSSRDLVQQRTTQPNGDTVWQNSPLVSTLTPDPTTQR